MRGERGDHSLLGSPVKIGERPSLNLGGHGLVGLVHGIPAERGNHSWHDAFVFLRSPLVHAVGREFGEVGAINTCPSGWDPSGLLWCRPFECRPMRQMSTFL